MKNILSITDIQALLTPLIEQYWGQDTNSELGLEEIYNTITQQLGQDGEAISEDILSSYEASTHLFEEKKLSKKELEYVQNFSFICQLAYDICMRKQLIERLIDQLPKSDPKKKKK